MNLPEHCSRVRRVQFVDISSKLAQKQVLKALPGVEERQGVLS